MQGSYGHFLQQPCWMGMKSMLQLPTKHTGVVTEDFEDKEFGGYYMELSSNNKVANDIKHTYAQAFVIYALCKYYEFRRLDSVMQKIQAFFSLLEEKAKDPDNTGYRESFTRDWKIYGGKTGWPIIMSRNL